MPLLTMALLTMPLHTMPLHTMQLLTVPLLTVPLLTMPPLTKAHLRIQTELGTPYELGTPPRSVLREAQLDDVKVLWDRLAPQPNGFERCVG